MMGGSEYDVIYVDNNFILIVALLNTFNNLIH